MRVPVFLALLLTASVATGQDRAIPQLTGRVVDLANILLPETEYVLDERLRIHEEQTSNQIAVLTVTSLEGESIESFSLRVANGWGLGQAGSDNGILVTVAVEDRRMRIEVGYGLEEQLPDALAGQIIREEMTPRFRDGDFDGGVSIAVESIMAAFSGDYVLREGTASSEPGWILRLIMFASCLFFPVLVTPSLLVQGPVRWFAVAILTVFVGIGGSILTGSFFGALAIVLLFLLPFAALDIYMSRSPKWIEVRKQVRANTKSGKSTAVKMAGLTFNLGGRSSSGGSGGSSSGGFSGGGGSFGGGGSSGSW